MPPVAGIALTPDARGYWLLEPDGWNYALHESAGPAPSGPASAIVSVANSQVNSDPIRGQLLQPLRAVRGVVRPLRHLGVAAGRRAHPLLSLHRQHLRLGRGQHRGAAALGRPLPGDAVLYGTGPGSTATSVHVGSWSQVWPDGARS